MTTQEIIKYVSQLEKRDEIDKRIKLFKMLSIMREYRSTMKINQSSSSEIMFSELQAILPLYREIRQLHNLNNSEMISEDMIPSQVLGTWNLLMDYFGDSKNISKTLHTTIKRELEQYILDRDPLIRYETDHVKGSKMHRYNIVIEEVMDTRNQGQSTKTTLEEVAADVVLSPFTLIKGIFNATTRKPLDIAEQKTLFKKLATITNPEHQQLVITRIISDYKKSSRIIPQSHSSKDLIEQLKNDEVEIDDKWYAIKNYAKKRNGDYLHNNGKALFNCINAAINSLFHESKRIAP